MLKACVPIAVPVRAAFLWTACHMLPPFFLLPASHMHAACRILFAVSFVLPAACCLLLAACRLRKILPSEKEEEEEEAVFIRDCHK